MEVEIRYLGACRRFRVFPRLTHIDLSLVHYPLIYMSNKFLQNKSNDDFELTVWQKWWIVLSDQLLLFVQLDEYNPVIEVALSSVREGMVCDETIM